MVIMGKIVAPFGIQGWVKIKSDTATPESLSTYKELYLLIKDVWVIKKIEHFFAKANIFHAKLDNINNRNEAFALKGTLVGVPRENLPQLTHDEYYWVDLIGLDVINKDKLLLGKVESLIETGAHAVLVIKDGIQKRLIPFVAQYILNVNLIDKQIIVDWEPDYDN